MKKSKILKKEKIIAFMPIRAGSKSIPLKNFKLLAGKPLFTWTAEAVVNCPEIDKLVLSTDYNDIKSTYPKLFKSKKVEVFKRSPETTTDTVSLECAMFDYIERKNPDFDYFILIQATCPFTTSEVLTKALQKMKELEAHSLIALAPQKKFYWRIAEDEIAEPINYSPLDRPMRQQMGQWNNFHFLYWENGAFYITKKSALITSRCRVSGRIVGFPFEAPIDIDEPRDWVIAEQILWERKKNKKME